MEELMKEFEKIKKMKEGEKKIKENEKIKQIIEEQIIMGNPLLNNTSYSLKKKFIYN